MSETVSLDWIGATLRQIQAEQRTLRMENELLRKELVRTNAAVTSLVTRELLSEVLNVIIARIGNFEALMETRMDRLERLITKAEG